MEIDDLQTLAARQLADYDAVQPGTVFGDGATMSIAEAYDLQAAVAKLRCERDEKVVGFKVGCTSSSIREQLGIDHSIWGRLFDTERHLSGVELRRSDFANLAIEGELAVELAREPTENDFRDAGIPACVSRVIPVIELHNLVQRGKRPSAGELIANNAIHAGFVVGQGRAAIEPESELSLSISCDARSLAVCKHDELIATVRSSLEWLTEMMRERGDKLSAGQVVLTGSIPPLFPIASPCCVRVDAGILGHVEASIE